MNDWKQVPVNKHRRANKPLVDQPLPKSTRAPVPSKSRGLPPNDETPTDENPYSVLGGVAANTMDVAPRHRPSLDESPPPAAFGSRRLTPQSGDDALSSPRADEVSPPIASHPRHLAPPDTDLPLPPATQAAPPIDRHAALEGGETQQSLPLPETVAQAQDTPSPPPTRSAPNSPSLTPPAAVNEDIEDAIDALHGSKDVTVYRKRSTPTSSCKVPKYRPRNSNGSDSALPRPAPPLAALGSTPSGGALSPPNPRHAQQSRAAEKTQELGVSEKKLKKKLK